MMLGKNINEENSRLDATGLYLNAHTHPSTTVSAKKLQNVIKESMTAVTKVASLALITSVSPTAWQIYTFEIFHSSDIGMGVFLGSEI